MLVTKWNSVARANMKAIAAKQAEIEGVVARVLRQGAYFPGMRSLASEPALAGAVTAQLARQHVADALGGGAGGGPAAHPGAAASEVTPGSTSAHPGDLVTTDAEDVESEPGDSDDDGDMPLVSDSDAVDEQRLLADTRLVSSTSGESDSEGNEGDGEDGSDAGDT